jgi:hypothetical protein
VGEEIDQLNKDVLQIRSELDNALVSDADADTNKVLSFLSQQVRHDPSIAFFSCMNVHSCG